MVCTRCGGFTVHDYFYGATDYFAWQCLAFRCVNCGAISNIQSFDSSNPSGTGSTSHSRARHANVARG
jgi:hypothetical protein